MSGRQRSNAPWGIRANSHVFGLGNSLATFQTMMNAILRDLIDKGVVVVYIDDILIFTETKEGHNEIVEEVLKRLEENDLFLKPEKLHI